MILVGAKAAKPIAKDLGKHRNHAIREVDAVSARYRFAIQFAFRRHVVRHVRDMNAHAPTVLYALHLDGIVEVASIVGINGEDEAAAKILAVLKLLAVNFGGKGLRLTEHLRRKLTGKAILSDDREYIDSRTARGPEHLDDMALRVDVARRPGIQSRDNFVSDVRKKRWRWPRNVKVVDKARVISDDEVKVSGFLEGAYDRVVCPLEDSNNTTLAARRCFRLAEFPFKLGSLRNQTGHNAIAVHSRESVFTANVEILLACLLTENMRRAGRMELDRSCNQISISREDIAILANPGDFAAELHFPEQLAQLRPLLNGQTQGLRDLNLVESPFTEKSYNPRAQFVLSALTRRFFFAGHVCFSRRWSLLRKKMLAPLNFRFHLHAGMSALKSPRGFTIIELLVVVAIIGVLMSLLFPAVQGALDAAKKAQAKNDVTQIATAIVAFDMEYGRMPSTNSAPEQLTGGLLNALVGSNDTINPRKIVFIEVLNFKRGKGGILNGIFVDPWAKPYYSAFDIDYDNQVGVSTNGQTTANSTIMKKVGVWNNNTNNRQQVRSWD